MSKVVWIVAPIHKLRVPSIQYICHYGFTLSVVVLGSATNIQVLDEVESAVTKSFPEDSERCHNGLVGVGSVINYDVKVASALVHPGMQCSWVALIADQRVDLQSLHLGSVGIHAFAIVFRFPNLSGRHELAPKSRAHSGTVRHVAAKANLQYLERLRTSHERHQEESIHHFVSRSIELV